jgi:hypothetical protein
LALGRLSALNQLNHNARTSDTKFITSVCSIFLLSAVSSVERITNPKNRPVSITRPSRVQGVIFEEE